jgi:hypothetical protein
MSGLSARLFPAALSLFDSPQRAPARMRTETLQRRSPLPLESFIAARPVARMLEKKLLL